VVGVRICGKEGGCESFSSAAFGFCSCAYGSDFLNEACLGCGDGRGGSKVHPCTVLPKRRVLAAFALGVSGFIKKIRTVRLTEQNPKLSKKGSCYVMSLHMKVLWWGMECGADIGVEVTVHTIA
jgi:hypothetical protein